MLYAGVSKVSVLDLSQHIAPLLGDLICSQLYAEITQMDITSLHLPSYSKTIYSTLYFIVLLGVPWASEILHVQS